MDVRHTGVSAEFNKLTTMWATDSHGGLSFPSALSPFRCGGELGTQSHHSNPRSSKPATVGEAGFGVTVCALSASRGAIGRSSAAENHLDGDTSAAHGKGSGPLRTHRLPSQVESIEQKSSSGRSATLRAFLAALRRHENIVRRLNFRPPQGPIQWIPSAKLFPGCVRGCGLVIRYT
jgi:hypothetical protein